MTPHNIEPFPSPAAPRETGKEGLVVLLHSSACSGAQWRRLEAELAQSYQVLAPDLYGYGGSEAWAGPGPLKLADEAARIWNMIKHRPGPIHLVGHSYGGAVALRLALDHGQAFDSLTLIEPVAFHLLQGRDPTLTHFFGQIRQLAESVWRGVAEGKPEAAMGSFVDYWNGYGSWDRMPDYKRQAVAASAGKVAMDFFSAMTETRGLDAYRRIELPTLILAGDHSPAPVRYIAGLLGGVIPSAGMRHLAGMGHMMPLTHPGIVNPIITRHVEAHSKPLCRAA